MRSPILLAGVVAFIGGLIRIVIASRERLWLDELHTSWTVGGPMGEIASRGFDGNQAPLFFWLTSIPVHLLGESEFSLRIISLLAGIGLILAASWIVWKSTCSSLAAFVVVWCVALDASFIFYATEARPYALLQFLSVMQVLLFYRFVVKRQPVKHHGLKARSPDVGLAIVSVALMYVHYTALWLFVAEALFLFTCWIYRRGSSARSNCLQGQYQSRMVSTLTLVLILCLPLVVSLVHVFRRRGNWESVSSIDRLFAAEWGPLAIWILIPIAGLMIERMFSAKQLLNSEVQKPHESRPAKNLLAGNFNRQSNAWLGFVFLWSIVPFVGVTFVEYFGIAPMALPRYTQIGAAGLPIFAGLAMGACRFRSTQRVILILLVVFSCWQHPLIESGVRNRDLPKIRYEDWKSPVDQINLALNDQRPVFLFSNLIEDVDALENDTPRFQAYLRFPVQGLYAINDRAGGVWARPTLAPVHFSDQDYQAIRESGGAWVLMRVTPDLLFEVEMTLREHLAIRVPALGQGNPETDRSQQAAETNGQGLKIRILETPGSPVYLMSIEL